MGRKSREKGKRGEREACDFLRDLFPDVRRRAMQARGGGEGADLEGTDQFHIEVGVGNVSPATKFEQARNDACGAGAKCPDPKRCRPAHKPLALTRRDRGEWLVTMSGEDWKAMVRRVRELEQKASFDPARTHVPETCGPDCPLCRLPFPPKKEPAK